MSRAADPAFLLEPQQWVVSASIYSVAAAAWGSPLYSLRGQLGEQLADAYEVAGAGASNGVSQVRNMAKKKRKSA